MDSDSVSASDNEEGRASIRGTRVDSLAHQLRKYKKVLRLVIFCIFVVTVLMGFGRLLYNKPLGLPDCKTLSLALSHNDSSLLHKTEFYTNQSIAHHTIRRGGSCGFL